MTIIYVQGICQRARELADSDDFQNQLAVLDHKERAGWPSKVVDRTNKLFNIRTILYNKTNKTFKQAADDYGIEFSRSTFEQIANNHCDNLHP